MNEQSTVDLIRDVKSQQKQIDNLVQPEISRYLVTPFLDLPGKVGIWYAGNVQRSTGDIYDASNQGRTLTITDTPVFNRLSNGIAYCDYDGSNDLHYRNDETDLDVTGTETIFDSTVRGLTIGLWVNSDSNSNSPILMSKYNTSQQSWLLEILSTNVIRFVTSVDGTTNHITDTTGTNGTAGTWHFIVARFAPSTEKAIFIDGIKETDTSSITASIFNSTTQLQIAAFPLGNFLNGKISISFMCANALPDGMISRLFNQTRTLYGV